MAKLVPTLAFLVLTCSLGIADAQYVVVLKNGGQLPVQNYRQEGNMMRLFGPSGEMAININQIETIRRTGASETTRPPAASVEQVPAQSSPAHPTPPASTQSQAPQPISAEQERVKKRAEEAKAYEERLKGLTEQLRELRERYALMTRGNQGPEPSFFTTEEAFKGQQDDLLSRLRDAQYKAQGLPTGSAATSPPFSLDAPPAYTERQKELSDLRSRMNQLENARQSLIEEMKAKGFEVGSLFLE